MKTHTSPFGATFGMLVTFMLVVACKDDETGPTCLEPRVPQCDPAIQASSAQQIIEAVSQLEYGNRFHMATRRPPVSADIEVTGTIELSATDFPLPDICSEEPGCESINSFEVPWSIDGVVPSGSAGSGSPYSTLTLTDTTVRFRRMVAFPNLPGIPVRPYIDVLTKCGTSCQADYLMCEQDGVCYATGYYGEYCRLCLEQSSPHCACWTSCGQQADDSVCTLVLSPDVDTFGVCQDGECVSDITPVDDSGNADPACDADADAQVDPAQDAPQ